MEASIEDQPCLNDAFIGSACDGSMARWNTHQKLDPFDGIERVSFYETD